MSAQCGTLTYQYTCLTASRLSKRGLLERYIHVFHTPMSWKSPMFPRCTKDEWSHARIILTVVRTKNVSCLIYSFCVARFLTPYATEPHQCCLIRLGHSDILILSCHGVYEIVHDVFVFSQRSSFMCNYSFTTVCMCWMSLVPYFVLECFNLNCTIQPDGCK